MAAPDKEIRKWVYGKLNGMVVDSKSIQISDSRIPTNSDAYIILSTIDKNLPQETKCGRVWNATINLDLVTVYAGHNGSRLFVEKIQDEALSRLVDPNITGFTLQDYYVDFAADLAMIQDAQSVYRKILILNFKLK